MKDLIALDKDILGEAYISNETMDNLIALSSYGSRFAGIPSEKKAVEYILDKIKDYNLDNTHKEEINYLGWSRGGAAGFIYEMIQICSVR